MNEKAQFYNNPVREMRVSCGSWPKAYMRVFISLDKQLELFLKRAAIKNECSRMKMCFGDDAEKE